MSSLIHATDFADQLEKRWSELATAKHVGLYVYRRDFLLAFPQLPPTSLEEQEKLEQLRALENGIPIAVVKVDYDSVGVDVPADVKRVERLLLSDFGMKL